jgi:hypothetical protein
MEAAFKKRLAHRKGIVMATIGETPRQERWLEFLIRRRQQVAYGLFGVGAALVGLALWLYLSHDKPMDYLPEMLAAVLLALVAVAAGLWQLLAPAEQVTLANTRILVLAAGGLAGLVIALCTAMRAWWWRDDVIFGGLPAWQGKNGWRLWVCVLAELAGLVLMFASLLLARTEERSNAILRRLLYGYNAVLTGLLLLAILVVANVLVYTLWPASYSWTKTRGLYALSPRSKNILMNLKHPARAYVIMAQGGRLFRDVQKLLDNCQSVTDKFQVEYIAPDLQPDDVKKLMARYPDLPIERGILLVYDEGGKGRGGKPMADFIKEEALSTAEGTRQASGETQVTMVFKGEDVLMSSLRFLEGGRTKPKIYFTQDNGELNINDSNITPLAAGLLHTQLNRDNFEIVQLFLRQPLRGRKLPPSVKVEPEVPRDAAAVVIANPRTPLTAEALAALRRYMDKGGKLLVLLDLAEGRQVTIPRTGLEGLLASFNVEVGRQFVMRGEPVPNFPRNPVIVPADAPKQSENRLAKALSDQKWLFVGVRPVRVLNRSGKFKVDVLLEVPERDGVWAENDLQAYLRPDHVLTLYKNGERTPSSQPIPIAVAVTEGDNPRLVVIGDASFASNFYLVQLGSLYYSLFENSLEWLVGRPESLGIHPQKSDRYTPNLAAINPSRLVLLPGCLVLLGIVGLGTGIWVVRRR